MAFFETKFGQQIVNMGGLKPVLLDLISSPISKLAVY